MAAGEGSANLQSGWEAKGEPVYPMMREGAREREEVLGSFQQPDLM